LALAAGLTSGQLINWEILTTLTPEIYDGHQPKTQAELDANEQYYLGLLGLELLNGRRPVEVTRFDDLKHKTQFFDDPRRFFDDDALHSVDSWTDESPALAYVLAQLLARDPLERLPSADAAFEELSAVAAGRLPPVLRRFLENELARVASEEFASRFY